MLNLVKSLQYEWQRFLTDNSLQNKQDIVIAYIFILKRGVRRFQNFGIKQDMKTYTLVLKNTIDILLGMITTEIATEYAEFE